MQADKKQYASLFAVVGFTLIEKGPPKRTYVPKLHNETKATTILTPTVFFVSCDI
jgi:hypothetical protein